MRYLIIVVLGVFFAVPAFAQPTNDENPYPAGSARPDDYDKDEPDPTPAPTAPPNQNAHPIAITGFGALKFGMLGQEALQAAHGITQDDTDHNQLVTLSGQLFKVNEHYSPDADMSHGPAQDGPTWLSAHERLDAINLQSAEIRGGNVFPGSVTPCPYQAVVDGLTQRYGAPSKCGSREDNSTAKQLIVETVKA